jgi:hypothetical protein
MPRTESASLAADPKAAASTLDEREAHLQSDFEWCLSDAGVRSAHAGQVVAVFDRRVWGSGVTHSAALGHAVQQAGSPSREFFALVVVPEA